MSTKDGGSNKLRYALRWDIRLYWRSARFICGRPLHGFVDVWRRRGLFIEVTHSMRNWYLDWAGAVDDRTFEVVGGLEVAGSRR